jgi:hypothetical protein
MDIITNFATDKEAVGAIFGGDQDKGKHKVDDPASSSRGSKRNNRKKKKNQQGKLEASADDLVATADRKKPRGPPRWGHLRQNAQRAMSLLQGAHKPQPRGLPHALKIF